MSWSRDEIARNEIARNEVTRNEVARSEIMHDDSVEEQIGSIFCPHCGTANRTDANYCNRCGTILDHEASSAPVASNRLDDDEMSPEPEVEEPLSNVPNAYILDNEDYHDSLPVDPNLLQQQPWLKPGLDDLDLLDDDVPAGQEPPVNELDIDGSVSDEESSTPLPSRLIGGIQGLLEPVNLATTPTATPQPHEPPRQGLAARLASAGTSSQPAQTFDRTLLQRVQHLMSQEPTLAHTPLTRQPAYALRIPWLFFVIAVVVGLVILLRPVIPTGTVQEWPGVKESYDALDALETDDTVLIYWAYDPSTAGELDLVALPVLQHLLEQQVQLLLVSSLPTGAATADYLLNRLLVDLVASESLTVNASDVDASDIEASTPVTNTQASATTSSTTDDGTTILQSISRLKTLWLNGGYLPGGNIALPLVGQEWRTVLITQNTILPESPAIADYAAQIRDPVLSIVFGAQAEDTQMWLEQVRTLNGLPIVVVTSADADPILRPYVHSQQIHGIVSGFDGGLAYEQIRTGQPEAKPLSRHVEETMTRRLIFQNWIHILLFVTIVFGNLAALYRWL
ncbi:MAG: zinc ribbon domain-containing protein [Chloroflexota bacterium]